MPADQCDPVMGMTQLQCCMYSRLRSVGAVAQSNHLLMDEGRRGMYPYLSPDTLAVPSLYHSFIPFPWPAQFSYSFQGERCCLLAGPGGVLQL